MYKPEPLTRRGSLRSLRSAPLLSTVLESTLSLTRIHPITSLELPGLDYAIETQSAIAVHHRELGTSLRSGIANVGQATGGRLGRSASIRQQQGEYKRVIPAKRLSRKLKPHIVADTVKQYISRAQRTSKGSREQQPNMEFLRGVYAFMQVSRSSVNYDYETPAATSTTVIAPFSTISATVTTTTAENNMNYSKNSSENMIARKTSSPTTTETTKTAKIAAVISEPKT